MTSKTMSVTEEAYNLLDNMKLKGESFTEVIIRLAKRRSLTDYDGLWKDIPIDEIAEYYNAVGELRKAAPKDPGRCSRVEGC